MQVCCFQSPPTAAHRPSRRGRRTVLVLRVALVALSALAWTGGHPAPAQAQSASPSPGPAPGLPGGSLEDDRTVVPLPPAVRTAFLAEMRDHIVTLDDILLALAEGNPATAADIASVRLDFGHVMWQRLMDSGLSEAEVARMKEHMAQSGMGPGQGRGMGAGQGMGTGQGMGAGQGMGRGFGRWMPEGFRALGQEMHAAAGRFAETARAAATPPSAEDLAALIAGVQEITTMCRACHMAYRVADAP